MGAARPQGTGRRWGAPRGAEPTLDVSASPEKQDRAVGCDGGIEDTPTLSGSAAPEQPVSTQNWDQCRGADREGPSL